jgi:cytochrome c-type biogenesis protein CcmH/NrfF
MRAFLIAAGTVFGLIVAAHAARLAVEPAKANDPWFWLFTIVAVVLGAWAWILVWQSRSSTRSRG